ncbi:MAG: YlbF family regulator [Erysipelotrichia bacterium]|nr:YlbF family regulator [Erysipelotrichia bacterium]
MDKSVYVLAMELKQFLKEDCRLQLLDKLEIAMNQNAEVMALAYQKDIAVMEYSTTLNHFPNDAEVTVKARQQLFQKKKALDEHPLVRQYLSAYSEVRDLYFTISKILFGDLSFKMKEHP